MLENSSETLVKYYSSVLFIFGGLKVREIKFFYWTMAVTASDFDYIIRFQIPISFSLQYLRIL